MIIFSPSFLLFSLNFSKSESHIFMISFAEDLHYHHELILHLFDVTSKGVDNNESIIFFTELWVSLDSKKNGNKTIKQSLS